MAPSPTSVCTGLAIAVIASACSGAPTDQTQSPSVDPVAPSPAASPASSLTPATTGSRDLAAPADFYCDAADDGAIALAELLSATDRKSAETGVDTNGGDAAVMRSSGRDMLAAMDTVVQSWTTAAERIGTDAWADADPPVTDDRALEAYAEYLEYLDVFARPEATIAAHSATIEEYSLETAALLTEAGTIAVATEGAVALNDILNYHVARCGDVPLG